MGLVSPPELMAFTSWSVNYKRPVSFQAPPARQTKLVRYSLQDAWHPFWAGLFAPTLAASSPSNYLRFLFGFFLWKESLQVFPPGIDTIFQTFSVLTFS